MLCRLRFYKYEDMHMTLELCSDNCLQLGELSHFSALHDLFVGTMRALLQLQYFINNFETIKASFRCSLDVHRTLGLQSDNCMTLFHILNLAILQARIVIFQTEYLNKMFR